MTDTNNPNAHDVKAVVPVTVTADHIKPDNTLNLIRAQHTAWSKAGCTMVAAFALHMIAGQFPPEGEAKRSVKESADQVLAVLSEGGASKPKAYQYSGLAKTLVQKLAKRDRMGGTIKAVLQSDSEEAGLLVLSAEIDRMTKGANTLDSLGTELGLYGRQRKEAAEGGGDTVKATKADHQAVVERLKTDTSIFTGMTPEERLNILNIWIANATADECEAIGAMTADRLKFLAENAKPVEAEQAKAA